MRREAASAGARAGWLLSAPALAIIGVFFLVPVLGAFAVSFTDYDLYSLADIRNLRFVGFDNYLTLLSTPVFWRALGNTAEFVVLGVPLSLAASLSLALLIDARAARFKAFMRTALFAPVVTTLVAVSLVWRYLFHSRYGFIDYFLVHVGFPRIDWLGDPRWSMPAIVLLATWKNFGYNMIILLASLQGIPEDLYDAAHLEGAGAVACFRHITLPLLAPTLTLVGILTVSGYFQLFAEPYVMTEGGPLQSTLSVLYYMFDQGFVWWRLGYASSIAFVLFALILALTGLQLWLARRVDAA